MPKCSKCTCMLAPDMMITDDLCVFCRLGLQEVTMEKEAKGTEYKYSKKKAIEDYRVYLRKLSDNPKIAKLIINEKMRKIRNA